MGIRTDSKGRIRVQTFSAGQNSADEPTTLGTGYAQLIENGIITDVGIVEQRNGLTAIDNGSSTSGSTILGLTRFTVGSTIDSVYRMIGSSLQVMSGAAAWKNIDTGFTSGTVTNFVQAKDLMFILNGTDNVHTMNSAESVTDEGNTNADPPKTTVGEYMPNNRLFLGGSKTDSERDFVWFSDSLDPQTFDRNVNVFKVRSGGGGKITALKQFRQNELVIYKEKSIFLLSNTNLPTPLTDWSLTILNPYIGCKAGRTVANLGDDHLFLADDGVRLLSRTQFDEVRNGIISEPVNDIIEDINKDAISTACAWFIDNKYILAIPTGTATNPDKVLIWDSIAARKSQTLNAGWTIIPKEVWYPSVFSEYEFSDNKKTLMMGENRTLSRVYKALSGTTDNGSTIELRIRGPQHEIKTGNEAVWGPIQLVADGTQATNLRIEGSLDNVNFNTIETSFVVDVGGGADLPFNLPVDFESGKGKARGYVNAKKLGRSEKFTLQITHNQSAKSVKFNEYTLWAQPFGGNK